MSDDDCVVVVIRSNAGLPGRGGAWAPLGHAVVARAGAAVGFAVRIGAIATPGHCAQRVRVRLFDTAGAFLILACWAFREGQRRRRYPARRCDGRFRTGRLCRTKGGGGDGCRDESCTEKHALPPMSLVRSLLRLRVLWTKFCCLVVLLVRDLGRRQLHGAHPV
jgi:hypothetical protein